MAAAQAPLRGRRRELEILTGRLEALVAGARSIVVVEGAAGLGKTRLLDEAAARAAELGIRSFRGAQEPFGPFVPLGPILDALLHARDPLVTADELRELLSAPGQRLAMIEELGVRIEHAAESAPLLVMLDDLQWADAATLQALRVLPLQLARQAVTWIVALRPGYGSRDLAATLRALDAGGAVRVALAGLEPEAAEAAMADLLGAPPTPAFTAALASARGQPQMLVDLVVGLREHDAIVVEDGAARLLDERVPPRLLESAAERIDHLPNAARELVQLTAVFGRWAGITELAELLGWSRAELGDPLGRALASGLIVEEGGRLGFPHEQVREAVEASIPTAVRRALLRQGVDLQLAQGATAASVGTTLAAIARPGDRDAVEILRRAVAELAGEAPGAAADLGLRAIELAGARSDLGAVLVAETIPLLWHAGRTVEAREVGGAALDGALSPEHEAAIRFALARMDAEHSVADAAQQGRRGSELEGVPEATRDRLLAAFAVSSARIGSVGAEQHDAARAAAASADPAARVAGLVAQAMTGHFSDWRGAFALTEQAVAVIAEAGDEARTISVPEAWMAYMLHLNDLPEPAFDLVEEGLRQARRGRPGGSVRQWTMLRAGLLLDLGRLAEAAAEARTALRVGEQARRPGDVADASAWYVLGRAALDTGDRATLRAALAVAEDVSAADPVRVRRMADWLRAAAADSEGDHDLAMRFTAPAFAPAHVPGQPMLTFPQSPADEVLLVRMALAAEDRDRASGAVAALQQRKAANPGLPSLAAATFQARGLLDGDVAVLRRAVDGWRTTARVLATAWAIEDVGAALRRSDEAQAIVHLEEARAIYESVGAERHAARVRSRLRRLGRRPRRATPPAPPAEPVGGLTPAEMAVAMLVAEGATNRQAAERLYLSPHTVSSHLRQAYAKLGIRSRGELAARLVDPHERAGS